MISRKYTLMSLSFCILFPMWASATRAEDFLVRTRTVGFMEYYIQREVERQSADGLALMFSEDGLMICLPNVFPEWVPPDQFRDVRVFPAGNPEGEGLKADYLGQDWVTGWHYIRLQDPGKAREYFDPITNYEPAEAEIGETIWGICMTPEDLDYIAYYREGKLSTVQPLPLDTAFITQEIATPGGPVFTVEGKFAGWAGRSIPMERDMWIGSDFFRANIRNPDETHIFLLAEAFLEEVTKRIPEHPLDHKRPWIGISGTQPLDKETARFMGMTDQGVVIISEVLPDSPADQAGIQDRDMVIRINGEPMPRMKPDSVMQIYFERALLVASIGEPLVLTLLRGDEEVEVEVIPQPSPTLMKEAKRQYFEEVGLTIREFILNDSIQRREDYRLRKGVVVNYIRPNSPAATGQVKPGDWIQEIGGQEIGDYQEAIDRLGAQIKDDALKEIVLLVKRGNETTVLRIRK